MREYLGAGGGDYKGKDSKVDDGGEETSWNCFLTKFFLTPKRQAPCLFLTTWVHPQKRKIPLFSLVKKQFSKIKVVWKK